MEDVTLCRSCKLACQTIVRCILFLLFEIQFLSILHVSGVLHFVFFFSDSWWVCSLTSTSCFVSIFAPLSLYLSWMVAVCVYVCLLRILTACIFLYSFYCMLFQWIFFLVFTTFLFLFIWLGLTRTIQYDTLVGCCVEKNEYSLRLRRATSHYRTTTATTITAAATSSITTNSNSQKLYFLLGNSFSCFVHGAYS